MSLATYDSLGTVFANALRVIKLCEARFKKGMTHGDLAALLRAETGCSKATSYRQAAAAIDVLGLAVDDNRAVQFEHGLRRRSCAVAGIEV